jgi:glyoxylase-like metal-dependent hydrolase (beta-lactamase superfamily II)
MAELTQRPFSHNPPMPRPPHPLQAQLTSPWQTEQVVVLQPNLLRLTAPNPGFMTGPGTNSYLVGDAACGFVVIDPGPADMDHLQRLWAAAVYADGRGGNIVRIVCTHSHPDHAPGAWPLQALCPHKPPVCGLPSAPTARSASAFVPDVVLSNKELIALVNTGQKPLLAPFLGPHTLQVIHTPGHAANHVCLLLLEDGVLFSGDHVLNGSTTVVDPPDGNMTHYLDSLDTLHSVCLAHGVQHILPAHGHVLGGSVQAAAEVIAQLKAHRLRREAKIAAVVQALPQGTPDDWLPLAYDDVPRQAWPVAKRSLLAHLARVVPGQSFH